MQAKIYARCGSMVLYLYQAVVGATDVSVMSMMKQTTTVPNLYIVTAVTTIGNDVLHSVLACNDGGNYGFAKNSYLFLRRYLNSVRYH